MFFGKKKLLMILSIINMYLDKYSWKDLERLREEIIKKVVEYGK
jgi:hypothetical protein